MLILPTGIDDAPGRLWIVELKETLSPTDLAKAQEQLRWALLRLRALCAVLDLPSPTVTLAIAFRKELLAPPGGQAKIDRHGRLGQPAPASEDDVSGWHHDTLDLGGLGRFPLTRLPLAQGPTGFTAQHAIGARPSPTSPGR